VILLDTTVLVYAKGEDHPLRDPCRELIAAVADRRIEATTPARPAPGWMRSSPPTARSRDF
jgi:predicted nucleic acid-binding protein